MDSKTALETLKKLRSKYSNQNPMPEWFDGASAEEKSRYIALRNDRYEALSVAISAVKSVRSLETAMDQIAETIKSVFSAGDDEL